MRSIITLLLFITFMHITSKSQDNCCTTAPNKMAEFGEDESFRKLHDEPLAYEHKDGYGKMITFPTGESTTGNAYFIPAKTMSKSNNWIFVFHEWWGLNDYIKKESDMWSEKFPGVNILAIDLYDGKVATTQEEARQYVQSVKNERAFEIIDGAAKYAGDGASVSTLGWCFGGAWSNQAAIHLAEKCNACVIYYGMPEDDVERLKLLKAPVLGIFALQDQNITPAIVDQFKKNLDALGIHNEIHQYDAVHAFANPSNPKYDAEKTADARNKTEEFLKRYIK